MSTHALNFSETKNFYYHREQSEKSLINLPNEVLEAIFGYLTTEEIGAFANTCSLCATEAFILPKWQALALRLLPKEIKCPLFTKREEASFFLQKQRVLRKIQAKRLPFGFSQEISNKMASLENLWMILKDQNIMALADSRIKSGMVKRTNGQWSLCHFQEKGKRLTLNALGEYEENSHYDSSQLNSLILGPLSYKASFGPYSKIINTDEIYLLSEHVHTGTFNALSKKYPTEDRTLSAKELAKTILSIYSKKN